MPQQIAKGRRENAQPLHVLVSTTSILLFNQNSQLLPVNTLQSYYLIVHYERHAEIQFNIFSIYAVPICY
jgi:hypothetical protein